MIEFSSEGTSKDVDDSTSIDWEVKTGGGGEKEGDHGMRRKVNGGGMAHSELGISRVVGWGLDI